MAAGEEGTGATEDWFSREIVMILAGEQTTMGEPNQCVNTDSAHQRPYKEVTLPELTVEAQSCAVNRCLFCDQAIPPSKKLCSPACSNRYRCTGTAAPNRATEEETRKRLTESHVKKLDNGCWEWTGNRPDGRYGHIDYQGERWLTHRLAYFLATGKHPGDLLVMHSCDNPPCVNPAHLSLGTVADNSRDMVQKGRSPKGRRRPGTGPAGERNCKAKLTSQQVEQLRREYARGGFTYRTIARRYGIAKSQVGNILSGKQWKADAL